MSPAEAVLISKWRYPKPYDFYDIRAAEEDLRSWTDSTGDEGRYSARSGGEMVGFFSFGADTQVPGGTYPAGALDVGLGLRPDMTGSGLGVRFTEAGLDFARREFSPVRFRLSVAAFNGRAIKVYECVGFVETGRFTSEGGNHPFVIMERGA